MKMMIEIEALDNGSHRNQSYVGGLPEGWALIPDDMELPVTFPFVNIEVEEKTEEIAKTNYNENGDIVYVVEQYTYMEVVGMTAGEMPEPEPEPEPVPTVEERITTLEAETEELNEALIMILEGTVE